MTTLIRCVAALAFLTVGMRGVDAGNMFVLGDLLSGNSQSSAQGNHNPYSIYQNDFVQTTTSTTAGFYDSSGLGIQNGDSIVAMLAFSGLASDMTGNTTTPLGVGGFGALIFAGDLADVDGDKFNLVTSTGGVSAALGSPASGVSSNFLSLVVSETLDFSTASLVDIGSALNSGVALEMAAFDIAADQLDPHTFVANYFGSPGALEYTELNSRTSLALDVVSTSGNTSFWTVDRDPSSAFEILPDQTYQFGSFGNELFLNQTLLTVGKNISATANTGQNSFTSGGARAAMNPVPEPSTLAIFGFLGVAGLTATRRKSRKAA